MRKPSTPPSDGKVGVVVATYGGQDWRERGIMAAEESPQDDPNTRIDVYHWYGDDLPLGSVRNIAAKRLRYSKAPWEYDWLIFLDADDRLPPDYVQKMREGWGDVRTPLVQGLYPDGSLDPEPVRIHSPSLIRRNNIVVGAMVSAEHFWLDKGFRYYPCLEDWDLWLRLYCYMDATIGESEAVYYVGQHPNGRNQHEDSVRWYNKIKNEHQQAFRRRR